MRRLNIISLCMHFKFKPCMVTLGFLNITFPERVGEESTFSYSLFEHRVCPVHMNTYFTLESENTYLKTDILQYK